MQYYKYFPDVNRFDGIRGSRQAEKLLASIGGQPLSDQWQPVPVMVDALTGRGGDFPGLSGHCYRIPVFSERAWDLLQPLIGQSVEALPLRCKAGAFFAINVLSIEDCLDMKRSQFDRFENGVIYRVARYAFKRTPVPTSSIFRVPQAKNDILVSDRFKEVAEAGELKGLSWFPLE